jgi:hypothetical protein
VVRLLGSAKGFDVQVKKERGNKMKDFCKILWRKTEWDGHKIT